MRDAPAAASASARPPLLSPSAGALLSRRTQEHDPRITQRQNEVLQTFGKVHGGKHHTSRESRGKSVNNVKPTSEKVLLRKRQAYKITERTKLADEPPEVQEAKRRRTKENEANQFMKCPNFANCGHSVKRAGNYKGAYKGGIYGHTAICCPDLVKSLPTAVLSGPDGTKTFNRNRKMKEFLEHFLRMGSVAGPGNDHVKPDYVKLAKMKAKVKDNNKSLLK